MYAWLVRWLVGDSIGRQVYKGRIMHAGDLMVDEELYAGQFGAKD